MGSLYSLIKSANFSFVIRTCFHLSFSEAYDYKSILYGERFRFTYKNLQKQLLFYGNICWLMENKMIVLIGTGNNPMVGMTADFAVSIEETVIMSEEFTDFSKKNRTNHKRSVRSIIYLCHLLRTCQPEQPLQY
ncbi:hypothetical protein DWY69_02260 [Eisenbergiella massiliensis]|uniref:Uncharacterized protein n=1 Tax=Eisenbergiella massiliensis TaxID=1720294 RepID=A0A3E3IAU4_9FIRM|nr:hypothetical protein DXC51_03560 [Eisenbergiella massiliensis]RGE73935.1 hypothetical protein DWY69_02260 [Eisenbergiella massiliensis]